MILSEALRDEPVEPREQLGEIATTQPVTVTPTSSAPDGGGTYEPPPPGPVTPPQDVDENGDPITIIDGGGEPPGSTTDPVVDPIVDPISTGSDTTVQDLYPGMPEGGEFDVPDVPDPTGADVIEADSGVAEVGTPGTAETETGDIIDSAVGDVVDMAGTGEQTGLSPEQQVDAELARILGEDSPLLASARAEAMRQMNARGLTNTSMAAGATYDAMVQAAMPMAQQNAQQAIEREMANTELRQQAGQFTAEQLTRLRGLEAELGQDLSIFNAEQLNEAERLAAELRTAVEQGNQQAYNEAALQLAELQRDAEAQEAEMAYGAEERQFLERQAYNEQIIDAVSRLNEQFMIGEQQIDLENVRGTYNQLISTNETAATLFDSYIRSIGNVFDDPQMSTSQAGEAMRAMVNMLEGSLRMIAGINDMDFGDVGATIPGGGGSDEPVPNDGFPDGWPRDADGNPIVPNLPYLM
jgi:hypothetical protein